MTIIKLICVILIATVTKAENEDFFDTFGASESNIVTLCSRDGVSCKGAILAENWVLVKASCIFPKPPEDISIFRNHRDGNCADYKALSHEATTRRAYVIYNHPEWYRHSFNVAMVALDRPYLDQEAYPDFEHKDDALKKFEVWIKEVIISYTNMQLKHRQTYLPKALENPVKTFLFTIVLPSFAFMMFFVYVIFYTGSNKSCKMSRPTYHQFNYEKMEVTS